MTFTSPLETNIWIGKGEILRPKNILKNLHPHSHGCWVGKKSSKSQKWWQFAHLSATNDVMKPENDLAFLCLS